MVIGKYYSILLKCRLVIKVAGLRVIAVIDGQKAPGNDFINPKLLDSSDIKVVFLSIHPSVCLSVCLSVVRGNIFGPQLHKIYRADGPECRQRGNACLKEVLFHDLNCKLQFM